MEPRYFRITASLADDPGARFFLEIFRPRHGASQTPEVLREDCEPGTVAPLGASGHVCRPRTGIDTPVTDLFVQRAGDFLVLANLAAGDLSPEGRGKLVSAVREGFEGLVPPENDD